MQLWIRSVVMALACTAAVCLAAFLSVADNVPSLRAPFSALAVAPAFAFYEWGERVFGRTRIADATWTALATLPAGIAFLVWSYPALHGRDRIPLRSVTLAASVAVLSLVFFAAEWSHGITYQGPLQTGAVAFYNLTCVGVLYWLVRRNRASPSRATNLGFHTALFGWLAFCAFPWLGEGI